MNLTQKYAKSLNDHWSLRFKTRHPDEDHCYGVVTHIKSAFVVLRMELDFEFDGNVIFPKKSIKGCRDGKCERCYNEILRERGAIQKLRPTLWLDSCKTLQDVAQVILKRKIWPAVETLCDEHNKTDIFIGPITRLTDNGFFQRSYDAAGKWQKECAIPYETIFSIEFDSHYLNRFNSFMRKRIAN